MTELKEYIVTAANYEVLDELCNDIETPGGSLYIPNRSVEVANERPLSRNTHYYLSETEAELLRQDPRILAVEQLPAALGVEVIRAWDQTGNFEKSATIDSNDKNWGLLRTVNGVNVSNWGTDGLSTQSSGSISVPYSGKNVDVVVVDAHINTAHPEFSVNSDGTGGSRVTQFDWFTLSSIVGISTSGSYDYSSVSSNHGTHVAGTIAGNTQGWARNATIYNMEFSYTGANAPLNWELYIFDYIRAFHKNKSINPSTGKRNPTVTNHSWGYAYNNIALSGVTSVTYRGVTTAVTGTDSQKKTTLEANGVPVPAGTYLYKLPYSYAALNADVQDAIADGVIVISAAGNSYWNVATSSSVDYSNSLVASGYTYYHSRGMSPGAATGSICVGAASTSVQEYKTNFSNFGSRIDIFAPGQNIVSSVHNSSASTEFGITLVNDPRNSSYKLGSISGTSMASPQVAGYVACLLETYQNFKQSDVLNYLIEHSTKNQVTNLGSINVSPYQALGDSNNRYLFFYKERAGSGAVFPSLTRNLRPNNGVTYPRVKIRFGS